MIIERNGKLFAFGLNWLSLVEGTAKAAKATAQKNSCALYWFAEGRYTVGLYPKTNSKIPPRQKIYAGASVIAHALRSYPNIFAVLKLSHELYAVVGIEGGKPRRDFDLICNSQLQVEAAKKSFKETCGSVEIQYVTDTDFVQGTPIQFNDIASEADDSCRLQRVQAALPKSIQAGMLIFALVGIGGVAWTQYQDYQQEKMRQKLLLDQKKIQERFEKELANKRQQLTVKASEMGNVLNWLKSLETNIGGWYLSHMECAASKPMICKADYVKSKYRETTFDTFATAAGKRFDSVRIQDSGSKIGVGFSVNSFGTKATGEAIDGASSVEVAINKAGSYLMYLNAGNMPFVNDKGVSQIDFSDFALPAGVTKNKLKVKPPLYSGWMIKIPARDLPLLEPLPSYVTVESMSFDINQNPVFTSKESFLMVTVKGNIFAK